MTWLRIFLLAVVAIAAVVGFALYRATTRLPKSVVIAAGPAGGRYYELSRQIADRVKDELGVNVEVLETDGSLANLHKLRNNEADFALYQPDTARMIEHREDPGDAAFVANLYSEVIHIFHRLDRGIENAWDLRGKRVALGRPDSGDYAANQMLFKHLGINLDEVDAVPLGYSQIQEQFESGELDAACISAGLHSPIFQHLASNPELKLISVPYADAMALQHVSTWPAQIPAGYYRTETNVLPDKNIETVSRRAKLLTHPDAPTVLVEKLTEIVMDEHFQRSNELHELFEEGEQFATANPAFQMHPGAAHVFNPELKPLLNPDFVEATEGLRSFVVSLLVAGWLLARWLRDRRAKADEHRLDRFVRSVLDIERRQLGLDEDESGEDIETLQRLLDEVTELRQEVLGEFNAHHMNEDPSVACFVQMCHALSDKINAKLTRQRLDRRFELMAKTNPSG